MATTIEIPEGFELATVTLRAGDIGISVHVCADGNAFGYVHLPGGVVQQLTPELNVPFPEALARCVAVLRQRKEAARALIGPVDVDADGRPVEAERAAE